MGGVGWRSTVDYYAGICRRCEEGRPDPPCTPEIVIESLDLGTAISYLGVDDDDRSWIRFDEYHRSALVRLVAAGVDVALIASNTPHHRLESITRGIDLPVVDLFEATAREVARLEVEEALVLGTATTMDSRRLAQVFAGYGVESISPRSPAVRVALSELIADVQTGRAEGGRARLTGIVHDALRGARPATTAVCLACTELPLAFPELSVAPSCLIGGVRYVNTTAVHVDAVLRFALGEEPARAVQGRHQGHQGSQSA